MNIIRHESSNRAVQIDKVSCYWNLKCNCNVFVWSFYKRREANWFTHFLCSVSFSATPPSQEGCCSLTLLKRRSSPWGLSVKIPWVVKEIKDPKFNSVSPLTFSFYHESEWQETDRAEATHLNGWHFSTWMSITHTYLRGDDSEEHIMCF